MMKIERLQEIAVFQNSYGTLYNDKVVGPTGSIGQYLRWVWAGSGVVVVPVKEEKIALVQMFRYSPGIQSIEIPGGGIEENESIVEAAKRELIEEMGLVANKVWVIGRIYPDTGILANAINVAVASVDNHVSKQIDQSQEIMEAIDTDIIWKTLPEFIKDVAAGLIMAGTTLSAVMLYMAWLEQGNTTVE